MLPKLTRVFFPDYNKTYTYWAKTCLTFFILLITLFSATQPELRPLRPEAFLPLSSKLQWMPRAIEQTGVKPALFSSTSILSNTIDYPTEDCFTYTYQLQVGNAASIENSQDAFTATNGSTYLVGKTFSNGIGDGLLQKLDEKGTVAWSKTIGRTDRDEVIRNVRQLPNGNLILIGTSMLADGSDKKVFFAATTQDGTVIWVKTLASVSSYKGAGIVVTSNEGVGFVADNETSIIYGRITEEGNLVWLKKLQLFEDGSAIGIVKYDYNGWFIACTGTQQGRKVGAIIKVEPKDGAIVWFNKLGGTAVDIDYILHDLEIINLRPRITGIYAKGGAPFQLFKLTVNTGTMTESVQTFQLPGVTIDATAQSVICPLGEVIAFVPTGSSAELYTFKMITEAYPDTLTTWRRKFSNRQSHKLTAIERTHDGGYLFISDKKISGVDNDIHLTKIDSAGLSGSCDPGTDFGLESSFIYNPPVQPISLVPADINGLLLNENWVFQDRTFASSYFCKSLTCPPQKYEDPCMTTFYRKYRSAGFCDLGSELRVNRQGEILVLGRTRTNAYEPETTRGLLLKLDSRGKILVRNRVRVGETSEFYKQIPLNDGSVLVAGYSRHNNKSYMTLTKLSDNLEVQWNRAVPIYPVISNLFALSESEDGSIFFSYQEGSDSWNQDLSLLKLDKGGNVLWLHHYQPQGQFITTYNGSMCQDDAYLYTAHYSNGTYKGLLIKKLRKSDGSVVWAKVYDAIGADQTRILNNFSLLGDKLVLQGDVGMQDNSNHSTIVVMDKEGNILNTKTFRGWNFSMTVTGNQQLALAGYIYDGGRPPYVGYSGFLRLDSNLQVLYSKKIYTEPSSSGGIAEGADGFIYETGTFFYKNAYNNDLYVKKYGYDGVVGSCFIDSLQIDFGKEVFKITAVPIQKTIGTVNLENLPYLVEGYSLQQNDLLCGTEAPCTSLKLAGPSAVCDDGVQAFSVTKNLNCRQPVYFSFDPKKIRQVYLSDDTLKVQFLEMGQVTIKASIFTGCIWLHDSLAVTVGNAPRLLSLGADTTLCTSNTLLLNAGKGYQSYLWQDGATDSTYRVKVAGTYHVQVKDGCGNTFKDTIRVSAAPPIPFSLGADRSKCNQDTIQLTAPSGFINYRWSTAGNSALGNAATLIVNPDVGTTYFLQAEKSPGCFAYDTIRVGVNHSPSIALGRDTALCVGDSLKLDAGDGFSRYLWDAQVGGQVGATIIARSKGAYSVQAWDENGCVSKDTLWIREVFAPPAVALSKDTSLCIGTSRTLSAGSGFAAYQWNTGATAPSINVQQPGFYKVQVKDRNGCSAVDSVQITKLLPLPSAFLPADAQICAYESLMLKPNVAFKQYQWSNGAAASQITVSGAGLYWLEVTDANNCRGRDSVLVSIKQGCISGFHVPTAFTPGRDGKNDLFRPLVFGEVKQYQFTVYNRWGEVVFRSSEVGNGWDGKFLGKPQDTNVFVWTCVYQLEGAEAKSEKGTVLLIR